MKHSVAAEGLSVGEPVHRREFWHDLSQTTSARLGQPGPRAASQGRHPARRELSGPRALPGHQALPERAALPELLGRRASRGLWPAARQEANPALPALCPVRPAEQLAANWACWPVG